MSFYMESPILGTPLESPSFLTEHTFRIIITIIVPITVADVAPLQRPSTTSIGL